MFYSEPQFHPAISLRSQQLSPVSGFWSIGSLKSYCLGSLLFLESSTCKTNQALSSAEAGCLPETPLYYFSRAPLQLQELLKRPTGVNPPVTVTYKISCSFPPEARTGVLKDTKKENCHSTLGSCLHYLIFKNLRWGNFLIQLSPALTYF